MSHFFIMALNIISKLIYSKLGFMVKELQHIETPIDFDLDSEYPT